MRGYPKDVPVRPKLSWFLISTIVFAALLLTSFDPLGALLSSLRERIVIFSSIAVLGMYVIYLLSRPS